MYLLIFVFSKFPKNTEDAINNGHESITQQRTNLKLKNERFKQCYKPIILQPLFLQLTYLGKCMPYLAWKRSLSYIYIIPVHNHLDKKLKLTPQNIKYCQGNETNKISTVLIISNKEGNLCVAYVAKCNTFLTFSPIGCMQHKHVHRLKCMWYDQWKLTPTILHPFPDYKYMGILSPCTHNYTNISHRVFFLQLTSESHS